MKFGHTRLTGHPIDINIRTVMLIDILLRPYHLLPQVPMWINGLTDSQYLLMIKIHVIEVTPKKIFDNKKNVSKFTLK